MRETRAKRTIMFHCCASMILSFEWVMPLSTHLFRRLILFGVGRRLSNSWCVTLFPSPCRFSFSLLEEIFWSVAVFGLDPRPSTCICFVDDGRWISSVIDHWKNVQLTNIQMLFLFRIEIIKNESFFFLMRTLIDLHVDLWNFLVEVAGWCHYSIRDERCFVQMSNESRRSPSISLCCTKADATFNITDRIKEFLLLTASVLNL